MAEKKAMRKNGVKPNAAARPANTESTAGASRAFAGCPIVGLGASAGGLEALELFFRALSADNGMAFVVVQHLDPSHQSLLTEILQRSTRLQVVEATEQLVIEPNHVYVIPPNRDMTVTHGVLHLMMPAEPRGLRMPIDGFFRGLAEDQGERAVGVILSGTGTDGTQGLRAILGAGGIALAQEPSTAKYEGMPRSAINAGFVTHVMPPEKMPAALMDIARSLAGQHDFADTPILDRILAVLRNATGHDFAQYKKSTIRRRIERRMFQHGIESPAHYLRYLDDNPEEAKALFRELLINVTSFFRDPDAYAMLKSEGLPALLAGKPSSYVFRAWIPGCSTGEEAYSMAIMLCEYMDEAQLECKIQIYATDLDDGAIATARAGLYPPNIAQDVSADRLRRFFSKEDAGFRVKKHLRDMVVFAVHSVIKDPPFTRLDLLSCRNVLIYLEPELQDRLMPIFHYALKPGGILILSPSESIGKRAELFTTVSRKWKLYRATHTVQSTRDVLASGMAWATQSAGKVPEETPMRPKETNLLELSRRMLLQEFAPASVVTDLQGGILFVHGDTGRYLRPAPGQATLNVIEMAREGLQAPLREALRQMAGNLSGNVSGSGDAASTSRQVVIGSNGDVHSLILGVRPLPSTDGSHKLLLISFQQSSPKPSARSPEPAVVASSARNARVQELELELLHTKESLQAALEEQQASNEELKSANEELQSTNEELQSTNEELETSKEELQSLNEELVTVNAELQTKIDEMFRIQNDMKNLLDNINVGTIFLDAQLHIRRYTRDASRIFRLVGSDVGRPLADIKSDVPDEDLLPRAQQVLDTLIPAEREVRAVDGNWYLVRVQPYRTLENRIDGVVLTYTNITGRVEAAAERKAREIAERIIDAVREPTVVLNAALTVMSVNRAYCELFGAEKRDATGKSIYDVGGSLWDFQEMRDLLGSVLSRDGKAKDVVIEREFRGIGHRRLSVNAGVIVDHAGVVETTMLTIREIPLAQA